MAADLVKAAFEVERHAREEYAREPAVRRVIWDAWAAALNRYMHVASVQPRVITRWEPWMPFALVRDVAAGRVIDGIRLGAPDGTQHADAAGLSGVSGGTGGSASSSVSNGASSEGGGSVATAVGPALTGTGGALLMHNRHGEFFGNDHVHEMHVHSDDGWHVRGMTRLGLPVPMSGQNEVLAWASTQNDDDIADAFVVAFDHPEDSLLYRHDGEWRRAEQWTHELWVNTPAGLEQRTFSLLRTHHGPVVARDSAGRAIAVRIARMAEGGALQQWYDMGRAAGLDEFRAALAQTALPGWSTTMADASGNIMHVPRNVVPVRDTAFSRARPVDGNTAATDWAGYEPFTRLPHVLNPGTGWAGSERMGIPDAERSADSLGRSTPWADIVFATHVDTGELLRPLVLEWEEVGGTNTFRASRLDTAIDALRSWDGAVTVDSEAATLFVLWQERLRSGRVQGEYARFRALEETLAELQQDWSDILVPWGELNRLQRKRSERDTFDDAQASWAVPAVPSWTGAAFVMGTEPGPGPRRYGVSGSTWVSVMQPGGGAESRSVVPFGQSHHAASPHWTDQAPLYSARQMKPAWFTRADVLANATRTYRP